MKPINKSWLIQIEITNACTRQCASCTRFVGHYKSTYFMDLDFIAKAIDSLEGYHGGIGIMGGEPTLHPKFPEICELILRKNPPHKYGLWTSGHKWEEYKRLIQDTFKLGVYYNDHSDPASAHQPVLVAIEEVVDDKELMWKLIKNCWVQENWSPSINLKGGFFCEVAAAMDVTFNGPGGYPLEKGWWKKTPEQYQDQVKRYCPRCGAALPMERQSIKDPFDIMTQGNLDRLLAVGSPKALKGRVKIYDKKLTAEDIRRIRPQWVPYQYLTNAWKRKKDLRLNELWLIRGFAGVRRNYNKMVGTLKSRLGRR